MNVPALQPLRPAMNGPGSDTVTCWQHLARPWISEIAEFWSSSRQFAYYDWGSGKDTSEHALFVGVPSQ